MGLEVAVGEWEGSADWVGTGVAGWGAGVERVAKKLCSWKPAAREAGGWGEGAPRRGGGVLLREGVAGEEGVSGGATSIEWSQWTWTEGMGPRAMVSWE